MDQFDFSTFLTDTSALSDPYFDADAFLTLPQHYQDQGSNSSSISTSSSLVASPDSPGVPQNSTNGLKLRNCAACRMRRVKCEREPGQTSCMKCIAKGLVCTQLPPKARKTPVRTGKRIESAQALFGTTDYAQASASLDGTDSAMGPPAKRRREQRSLSVASELSPTSIVGKLITGELEATLTGSLLGLYDQMPTDGRIPLFQATIFRPHFESCGRRLNCMDPKLEPLAAVVLALVARISDHPLLIGGNGPDSATLARAIKAGEDLSEWGKRRTDACQALVDKALRVADEKGIWRDPTPENLATLMMIEGMADYENAQQPFPVHPGRPVGTAYMLHLKAILLNPDTSVKERVMKSGVGWTAFSRDAVLCATTGSQSVFSDDDCCLLGDTMPLPLDEALAFPEVDPQNASNPYELPFWIPFNSIMLAIADLGRSASIKLTGLRATRNPRVDEDFVKHYLATLRKIKTGFELLNIRSVRYLGPRSSAVGEAKAVHGFVKHLRATTAGLSFLLGRVLHQRKAQYSTTASEAAKIFNLEEYGSLDGPPRSEDSEYWERFELLRQQAEDIAFGAARELVELLAMGEDSLSLGTMSGTQMLFIRLPMWLSRLIDAPTFEEGGHRPDWTFSSKLTDLRTVLRAMNRIGWAYASYAKPAPWLRSIIARIETKQQQYIDASNSDPSLPFTPSASSFDFLPTPSDDYTGVASPWGCEGDQFDIPVSNDEDWEALLQSIVGSGVATEMAGTEKEVTQDEEVLVGMLQNLLT
ncbi:hypothetical protein JCM5353_003262 [Sporobolomyces roseus]